MGIIPRAGFDRPSANTRCMSSRFFFKVPTRGLGIDASLGLPVVEVTSPRPDGSYGAGSEITVNVRQERNFSMISLVLVTSYV